MENVSIICKQYFVQSVLQIVNIVLQNALRGPTQFFGNFFICGPIQTKFAQYM